MSAVTFCDELDFAVGWIHPQPDWMERAGHAVRAGGRVWVIDPIDGDGVEERIRALGEPAGVLRLLDRHPRDCETFAERLGVPLRCEPFEGVEDAPFEVVPILRTRFWREVALWFPAERTLVCADVLANAPGYRAPGETVGVHPLLRIRPPRVLARFDARNLLMGHGPGVHDGQAQPAIDAALDNAWRQVPFWAMAQVRRTLGR